MKKGLKIFSSSLIALTFALGNLDNASAKADSYDINNIEDLKAEIVKLNEIPSVNGEESEKKIDKRQDIMESTNPKILEEYNTLLAEDLKDFYSSDESEFLISQNSPAVVEDSTATIAELSQSDAEIEISTENVSTGIDSGIQLFAVNKKSFGDHDYKVDHNIRATLYPDSHTVLITNYKVKSTGLSINYVSTSGTYAIFPTTITKRALITDKTATSVGTDINGLGEYNVTIGGYNGIGLVSFDMRIASTIKWTAKSSNGQTVSTSYKVTGDKTQ